MVFFIFIVLVQQNHPPVIKEVTFKFLKDLDDFRSGRCLREPQAPSFDCAQGDLHQAPFFENLRQTSVYKELYIRLWEEIRFLETKDEVCL